MFRGVCWDAKTENLHRASQAQWLPSSSARASWSQPTTAPQRHILTRPVGCQKRHCQPHVHQVGSVGLLLDLAKTLSCVSILYQSQPSTWFHFTRHLKFERFWNQRPFSHPSGNGFCHRHVCLRTKTSSGSGMPLQLFRWLAAKGKFASEKNINPISKKKTKIVSLASC